MDFCTLTDIIKSNLVPAEDHKRAIACYRRVCAIDKPLNTTVHIDFDVHVYEVKSDTPRSPDARARSAAKHVRSYGYCGRM